MWGNVEQGVGEARERELADVHFKPALDKGAQLVRHHNTKQSSHDIIRRIIKNNPAHPQIEEELVDVGKGIKNMAVGEAVDGELDRLTRSHEAEMKALYEEMCQALKEKDEEMRKELERETRKFREQMDKMRVESDGERKRMEETMRRMQEEARQERERAQAEHMRQINKINKLEAELERNTGAFAAEREGMLQRIHELERQPKSGGGGCAVT
jgi:hypothetical protein